MRFLASVARGAWYELSKSKPPNDARVGLTSGNPHVFRGRVSLLDLDANAHVNNASLLLLTELARWRMLADNGTLVRAFREKWVFMVGSQAVRYRHEMLAFEPYAVETQLLAADKSWFWFRHRVLTRGDSAVAAQVLTRIIIKRGRDTITPADALRVVGVDPSTSGVPTDPASVPQIRDFLAWDAVVKDEMASPSVPSGPRPGPEKP